MFVFIPVAMICFLVGAVVGAAVEASNNSSVVNAIDTLKTAEKRAKATIDTIMAHKAS